MNMERGSSTIKFLSLALTATISVSCLTACSRESSETTTEETGATLGSNLIDIESLY